MFIQKFNSRYEGISEWQAHDQLILASATAMVDGKLIYATGGNDDCVAIWDVGECAQATAERSTSSNGKGPPRSSENHAHHWYRGSS